MTPRTGPDKHLCVLYRMGRSGEGPLAYLQMTYDEQNAFNRRSATARRSASGSIMIFSRN